MRDRIQPRRLLIIILAAVLGLIVLGGALRCAGALALSRVIGNEPLIGDFDSVKDDYQTVADALGEYYRHAVGGDEDIRLDFVICREPESGARYLGSLDAYPDALTEGEASAAFQRVCASFDSDFPLEYVDVYSDRIIFIAITGNFAVYYSADGHRPDKQADSFRGEPLDRIITEDDHWYQLLIH